MQKKHRRTEDSRRSVYCNRRENGTVNDQGLSALGHLVYEALHPVFVYLLGRLRPAWLGTSHT